MYFDYQSQPGQKCKTGQSLSLANSMWCSFFGSLSLHLFLFVLMGPTFFICLFKTCSQGAGPTHTKVLMTAETLSGLSLGTCILIGIKVSIISYRFLGFSREFGREGKFSQEPLDWHKPSSLFCWHLTRILLIYPWYTWFNTQLDS